MNTFSCPFCNTKITFSRTSYITECEHFKLNEPKETRIPYIVSNLKNINEKSVVLDVGGYTGIFASCIINSFNPKLFIFEPTKQYCQQLRAKFHNKNGVGVLNYGLGNETRTETIFIDGQNTSIHKNWTKNAQPETVLIKNINEFINTHIHIPIDLISINCEGGEYEILPALIHSGNIKKCKQILVQFHNIEPNSLHKATEICSTISATHNLTLNVGVWKWILFELK